MRGEGLSDRCLPPASPSLSFTERRCRLAMAGKGDMKLMRAEPVVCDALPRSMKRACIPPQTATAQAIGGWQTLSDTHRGPLHCDRCNCMSSGEDAAETPRLPFVINQRHAGSLILHRVSQPPPGCLPDSLFPGLLALAPSICIQYHRHPDLDFTSPSRAPFPCPYRSSLRH